VRRAVARDLRFLEQMLTVAAAWRPGSVLSVADALANPAFAHYVDGWPRPGDAGVVAERGGTPVGAAWYRFLDETDPGFGFVAADVPELSVGVVADHRGRGVGRRLLDELLRVARASGVDEVSLSVEPENPAVHLYTSLGFRRVDQVGGAWTMLASSRRA
jgi:ribosomal protein S18 acetylase RimI-like enzyme